MAISVTISDAILKAQFRFINDKLSAFPSKACKISFQKSPFVSRNVVVSAFPDKENHSQRAKFEKPFGKKHDEGNESNGGKRTESSATTVEKPAQHQAESSSANIHAQDDVLQGLKKALIDSAFGTERGLLASSEIRADITEVINKLEAKNPTPAPTDALQLLNGKWILVYTSWSELFPLLAAGTLPLVKVGEISQTIDADKFTAQNSVIFTGPYSSTSFATFASFEVRSPQRVQIKFEQGIIGTPQLIDSIVIPDHFMLMGQKVDLSPLQGIIQPLQEAASSVAKSLNAQPPFKFPIKTDSAQSWLLTTYLDHELRISRGDGGSVFVLIKEDSQLLAPL